MITFDVASRYAVKADAAGFLAWLLPDLEPRWRFRRWLDPQSAPRPGDPERRCDTIAELADAEQMSPPWAFVIELFTRPDADAVDRLLEYLGRFRRELRHGPYHQDRYAVGAALVFLTGTPAVPVLDFSLPGQADVSLRFGARRLAVAEQDAVAVLERIGQNRLGRCVLPWVPLMRGGERPETAARWRELALAEPDRARRGDYGTLAVVFAGAAGYADVWKTALEGWNVEESTVWNDLFEKHLRLRTAELQRELDRRTAEARREAEEQRRQAEDRLIRARREDLLRVLSARFPGPLPPPLTERLQAETDLEVLGRWITLAATAVSPEGFQAGLDV